MQKVDIIIGVVGAAALLATVAGVLLYEDGATEYEFLTTETSVQGGGPAGQGSDFPFDAPQNATAATFDIEIRCTGGLALAGGSGTVTVTFTAPDNSSHEDDATINVPQGAQCNDNVVGSISINHTWAEVPERLRGSQEEVDAFAMTWSQPIVLTVSVQGPNAQGAFFPAQPGTYTAAIGGTITVYHATEKIPDVESR